MGRISSLFLTSYMVRKAEHALTLHMNKKEFWNLAIKFSLVFMFKVISTFVGRNLFLCMC